MARTDFGQLLTGLQLQPGWTIRATDEGVISSRCAFRCERDSMFDLLPRRGTEHPKEPKLQSMAAEATSGELGTATIVVDYIGLLRDPSDVRYSFVGGMSSEPIETHPKFSLTDSTGIAGTPDVPLNGAEFDDAGHFVGFPNNAEAIAAKLVGVQNYLRPGLVFRTTFYTSKPALYKLADAGKRTLAPNGFPSGVALPAGCEWLTMAPVMEQLGNIFKITQDYQLSGPNGVNQTIYETLS